MLKLHSYFRSSAAYRCRIALNLKGLAHEMAYVHLIKDGGQHTAPAYRALNPQCLVPTLELGGDAITQSLAIIEYLDEMLAIACDIHPINNLRVLRYLKGPLKQEQAAIDAWYRHWVETGLAACEALLPAGQSRFCFGDQPTLADCCLVPQVYNARRLQSDLSGVPRIVAIDEACRTVPAFVQAAPEAQADAA
jgi:glutathione S-transferase